MGFEYSPVGSAELNLVLCPYLKIQTVGDDWDDDTTSSRYIEHIFDLEKKPHCRFV
jgi:hypothetical protein